AVATVVFPLPGTPVTMRIARGSGDRMRTTSAGYAALSAPSVCRRTLRNGHGVTEKPNDLIGNLHGGGTQIDRQRFLARIRFFESVDLVSQQLRGHEMAVTSRQMFGDQVPPAAQIDQSYLRSVADDDLAIGSFECGARDDAGLLLGALFIDPTGHPLEPWQAV